MADEFDDDFAETLIGTYVLAGITYLDHAEKPIEHKQVHGRVVRASRREGVVLKLEPSGDEFRLPPCIDAFKVAAPGQYRLRSSGEVVTDPDFTCMWSARSPTVH